MADSQRKSEHDRGGTRPRRGSNGKVCVCMYLVTLLHHLSEYNLLLSVSEDGGCCCNITLMTDLYKV